MEQIYSVVTILKKSYKMRSLLSIVFLYFGVFEIQMSNFNPVIFPTCTKLTQTNVCTDENTVPPSIKQFVIKKMVQNFKKKKKQCPWKYKNKLILCVYTYL